MIYKNQGWVIMCGDVHTVTIEYSKFCFKTLLVTHLPCVGNFTFHCDHAKNGFLNLGVHKVLFNTQYGSCLERKMKETIILRFYVCRVVYIYKCNVLKSCKQFCLLKGAFCVSWKVRILKWLHTGINEPIGKKLGSHVFFLFWNYRPCDLLYKHKKHISFPLIVYRQGIPNSPYDVWSMQLALAAGEISYHFGR